MDAVAEFVPLFQELGYQEGESQADWQSPKECLNVDSSDPGFHLLTDADIILSVAGAETVAVSDSDSDSEPQQAKVSHAEACEAFEKGLLWLESCGDVLSEQLLLVRKWRDMAARKRESGMKQAKLSAFFTSK